MLYETQNPHGGDVYGAQIRLDFSSNVNPLGPPPSVISAMQRACAQVRQYPDPYCRALTRAIAAHEGVPERSILCGAGAAELLARIAVCSLLPAAVDAALRGEQLQPVLLGQRNA